MSRLTPEHFLSVAAAEAAQRADTYDYVEPSEELAKSAALEQARRETEILKEQEQ